MVNACPSVTVKLPSLVARLATDGIEAPAPASRTLLPAWLSVMLALRLSVPVPVALQAPPVRALPET